MSRYYDDELYHYGRLGMKWGRHIFGKVSSLRAKRADIKALKQAQKAEKDAKKLAKKEQKRAETLDKLSKSPTYLWKNRDAFSTQELNKALDRINAEQRIHQASMAELKRGKDVADTIIGYGKTINDAYNTVDNLYKNFNSFKSGNFGKGNSQGGDQKKDDKKEDKKETD